MLDSKVEEFHSRDLDSLPTEREVLAVKEFSQTKKFQFHIMRDHRQGDLTTGGVSIRFVLILQLPYDYFYGACKSELIHFYINFLIFFY